MQFSQAIKNYIEAIPDQMALSLSSKTTVVTGTTGIIAAVQDWNWTAIVASSVAICGLLSNIYFQCRRDKREALLVKARIKRIRHGEQECD